MSEVMMSIGNTYQYEGNYAESLKYYEQVIPVFKKFRISKGWALRMKIQQGPILQ